MARFIEVTNPFEPFKDTKVTEHPGGISVRAWLQLRFPGFEEFERPTLILLNGKPLPRRKWGAIIKPSDLVNVVSLAGTPIVALYVIVAVLTVTSVVLALSIKTPVTGQTPGADPVYTLKGQRNQIRLGEPIEAPFGRTRMWPSYAAAPYNKYENNQQWLYQLFCMGQGQFAIEGLFIEDTPIANFQDVTYEVVPPGGQVTLFPDNVVTSVEVGNIELLGPNEPSSSGTAVTDSPGDSGLGIAATSHPTYSEAGPYIVNPAHTQTNLIELDVSLPRGLYTSQNNGGLGNATVTALFEAQHVDDAGAPIGAWFTIANFSKTLATVTPQRFTLSATVDLGRYQVRAARTNNKSTDAKVGDTLQWEQLRCFLPSTRNYGNVTMLAVKARASNNLNDNSSSRINVFAVRMLPTYSSGAWQPISPTRSIVWAFCDLFRNQIYGAGLADNFLDMDALVALDAVLAARNEYCDWIFDQRITVWEAAKLVALLARAVPMLNGTRITMVRSQAQTLPSTIFNQENIVKDSFRWEIKLRSIDEYDGLEVSYTDYTTWKVETVLCLVDGESGNNPQQITLNGCTSRAHAFYWGMWQRALARYQREQAIFSTGLEGHIPSYGDLIGIAHDIPKWSTGGFVTNIAVDHTTLTLSEPVTFGAGSFAIMLRKKSGVATGALACVAGADAFHVVLSSPLDPTDYSFDPLNEPPIFTFGKTTAYAKNCVVLNLAPGNDDTVEVTASPYRPEPFSHDGDTIPDQGNTAGNLPGTVALPSVIGLIVTKSPNIPNEVIATWNATRGALYYILQLSYDGTAWETLNASLQDTSFRFSVLPKYIYVRVAAITTGAGPWTYWVGDAPVVDSNIIVDESLTPNPVSGVTLVAGFGIIFINWVDPTNVPQEKLKNIHIYVTDGSATGWDTKPTAPSYSIKPGQQFFSIGGLADNYRKNIWLNVETVFGVFSSDAGPYSATTVNGITLDHLIVGGLQPVEILPAGAPLPSTGNYFGRTVFLQTDDVTGTDVAGNPFKANNLYKWVGTGTPASPVNAKDHWSASVPAVNITGQLTDAQIADLDAAKLTGTIVATSIADGIVTTPKLAAGSVTTAKLVANAITANEIASNAITAAKIGAGEVITSKLAAGAVTANELASNSIVAAKISAGAIVAAAIGTNEVIANTANIKDGVVSTAKIGDAQITTAKIGDLNVTTLKIAGNAVTVPISASAAGPTSVGVNVTTTLLTCASFPVAGSEQVHLEASFVLTPVDNDTFFFRFYRSGTLLREWKMKAPVIAADFRTISMTDAPGAGTYDYTLVIYSAAGNTGAVSMTNMDMLALSTKK